jgi:hypothetical protein
MTASAGIFPAAGSIALDSLYRQAIMWGLVVAVSMVIICAAAWAIGSAHAQPQTAAKAKSGVLVALIGALLLGAGSGYLAWLGGTPAEAFTADPASYKAETAAPRPGVEVIDKTSDWIGVVNNYRRSGAVGDAAADRALVGLAASCAGKVAAGQGVCPGAGQFYEIKFSPSQISKLTGTPTRETLAGWAPILLSDMSEFGDDMRVAMVAARNTQNGTAALIVIISAGPCPSPCKPEKDGAYLPNLLTHVTG